MVKTKTKYKVKWKNIGVLILGILVIVGILFTCFKIYVIARDYIKTNKIVEKIEDELELGAVVDDESTTTIKPDSTLSKFDAYWDYIKLGLLDIDMAKLKRINTDAVGYIEIKGTDFSFPIVQKDNIYYKKHSLDKSENTFGWIYMDESNNIEELDTNTIIYSNKNYFGVLSSKMDSILKEDWKSNDDNYIIRMYTNSASTLWQIISVYKTSNKDHLKTSFENEEEINSYIDSMLKNTQIKFKGYAKTDDRFLTITTNSKGTNLVVQAKLIKIKTY